MSENKQAKPVAFVDANGDLIAKTKLEPWTNLYTHPAQPVQPAGAQGEGAEKSSTCKQSLQVWVIPSGKGGGTFSWDQQDERFWTRMEPSVKQSLIVQHLQAQPAAAINGQMLEALKLADAALEGAHMNADVV